MTIQLQLQPDVSATCRPPRTLIDIVFDLIPWRFGDLIAHVREDLNIRL
jgi:hypothetical protein